MGGMGGGGGHLIRSLAGQDIHDIGSACAGGPLSERRGGPVMQ